MRETCAPARPSHPHIPYGHKQSGLGSFFFSFFFVRTASRPFSSHPSCVSCQDIVTRHLTEKSGADDQLPPLGAAGWAAGSQSELTPSESLATSDAVRNTLLPRSASLTLSHSHTLLLRERSAELFSTLHPRPFHPSL